MADTEPIEINTGTPRLFGQWANGAPQGDTIRQSELSYNRLFMFRSPTETSRLRASTRAALGRV